MYRGREVLHCTLRKSHQFELPLDMCPLPGTTISPLFSSFSWVSLIQWSVSLALVCSSDFSLGVHSCHNSSLPQSSWAHPPWVNIKGSQGTRIPSPQDVEGGDLSITPPHPATPTTFFYVLFEKNSLFIKCLFIERKGTSQLKSLKLWGP